MVETLRDAHDLGLMKGTLLIALSVVALTFAAICTVLLNLTTRRATLRQINASLLEISEPSKELRSPAARRNRVSAHHAGDAHGPVGCSVSADPGAWPDSVLTEHPTEQGSGLLCG